MVLLLAALLAACSDEPATSKEETTDVYSSIIGQLLAGRPATTTTTDTRAGDQASELVTVFVEPLGEGYLIDLSVQAGVVKSLDAVASVRFIDDRAEAIERDEPGKPVKKRGMLVALGPLVHIDDAERTVQVRRYVDEARHEDLTARVRAAGESWTVVLHQAP